MPLVSSIMTTWRRVSSRLTHIDNQKHINTSAHVHILCPQA